MRTRLALLLALAAVPAEAHAPFGVGGVAGGLLHPLWMTGHLIALIAVGLLIAQPPDGARILPWAAFALGLTGGLAALALAVGPTPAAQVSLAGAAMAGGLTALARPLPRVATTALAAATGVAIGLDSPPDALSLAQAFATLAATALSASLALALIVVAAARLTRTWQRIAIRIAGSWIAAGALMALALRLARM